MLPNSKLNPTPIYCHAPNITLRASLPIWAPPELEDGIARVCLRRGWV